MTAQLNKMVTIYPSPPIFAGNKHKEVVAYCSFTIATFTNYNLHHKITKYSTRPNATKQWCWFLSFCFKTNLTVLSSKYLLPNMKVQTLIEMASTRGEGFPKSALRADVKSTSTLAHCACGCSSVDNCYGNQILRRKPNSDNYTRDRNSVWRREAARRELVHMSSM